MGSREALHGRGRPGLDGALPHPPRRRRPRRPPREGDRRAVRDVAFLFGEKLKGLRRASVPVDAIPEERWAELLRAFVATPVLKQAWEPIVLAVAAAPERPVGDLLAERALGSEPPAWRTGIPAAFAAAAEKAYRKADAELVRRLAFAGLMPGLLGRVPATEVAAAVASSAPTNSAEVRA